MKTLLALLTALPLSGASQLPATWDKLFADYAAPGAPGASVIILDHDQVLFEKSYGLGDLVTAAPVITASDFYLASMSKQFTAMGIVMLKEEGKLGYDDPLSRFFPEFLAPNGGKDVTVRQLLHHTGGLKSYFDLVPDNPPAPVLSEDVIALLAKQTTTDFPAGSKYEYSNSGYVVLGQIIARVSGLPYHEFIQQRIFAPLGMNDSVIFERMDTPVPHRTYGYGLGDDGKFALDDANGDPLFAIVGDGGVYSSVEDLAKWNLALTGETLVSKQGLADIFTSGTLNDGTSINYGFGWTLGTSHGQPFTQHGGLYNGFHCAILRYPETGLAIIILTNRREGDPTALAQAAADAYFAAKP